MTLLARQLLALFVFLVPSAAGSNPIGYVRVPEAEQMDLDSAVYTFVSEDGVAWQRPELDRLELQGRPTHIVALSGRLEHELAVPHMNEFFGVTLDPAAADPAASISVPEGFEVRMFADDDSLLINMTVWESIEALFDFTYHSQHTDFLRRRREYREMSAWVAYLACRKGDV